MTISKRGFIALAACSLAATLFAGHHHHHRALPPNAYWCHKCGGDGYNWTWYGWKKTCGICDGRGWCVKRVAPVPAPLPPKVHGVKHHGGVKAPPPPVKHHGGAKTPAPYKDRRDYRDGKYDRSRR